MRHQILLVTRDGFEKHIEVDDRIYRLGEVRVARLARVRCTLPDPDPPQNPPNETMVFHRGGVGDPPGVWMEV